MAVYEHGPTRPYVATGRLWAGGAAAALVAALRADGAPGDFLWIGLKDPTQAEFDEVDDELQLHPLAVEDAIKAHQRPKLERYDDLTFAVVKPVRYVDHDEVVELAELALFLGRDVVITVRHGDTDVLARARHDLEADPDLLAHGTASVVHRVLDLVMEGSAA